MRRREQDMGILEVTKNLTSLLEREDLQPEIRRQIISRLNHREFLTVQQLQFEIDRITATLDMAS